MPYWAPFADMPMTSTAPRFAEMNASPVTQAGSDRPGQEEVETAGHLTVVPGTPMPSTSDEIEREASM